jgi:hypothetical protein
MLKENIRGSYWKNRLVIRKGLETRVSMSIISRKKVV